MRAARAWLGVVLTMAVAAGPAMAGEAGAVVLGEGRGQVVLSWDEFVKITGYDPAKKGTQVLTIPWAEVETLLGVKVEQVGKGTTVDLPWNEFKALLDWSIKRQAGEPAEKPPTDFIIASTEYAGTLSADGADFTLKAKIEVLRQKGWKRVPILPATIALTKATLPDGVFLNAAGDKFELLTDKGGTIEVALEFSVAVREEAGINQLTFQRVAPGSSVLDLSIARENVDVKVADSQSTVVKSADGKTQVAAAIPSGVAVAVSWERALPKVEAVPTKVYAETRTLVAVAEGMLLCQERVNFNILHTAVRELKLQAPADVSILDVSGNNVQDWRSDAKGELNVVLRTETLGSHSLDVTYERAVKDSVEAPVIRAPGVEREKGFIGVVAMSNVEIAAGQVTGATAIDVRQLPGDIVAMTNQPILLAFRYVGDTFSIPLTIRKHDEVRGLVTVVDRAAFTAMQLNDGRRMTKLLYSVRNNRNQFLRLKMPQTADVKAEIWSVEVSGTTVSPAKDEAGSVLIPLIRSAASAAELASFPVEIVYVETPDKTQPSSGTLHVELPACDAPVIHVMYSYYLPPEGKYTVGWGRSGFSGPLRLVEHFASLGLGPGGEVMVRNVIEEGQQMEEQINVQVAQRAPAGAEPIRVRLPLNGKLFLLEKILALPKDTLWFQVEYRGWDVPK